MATRALEFDKQISIGLADALKMLTQLQGKYTNGVMTESDKRKFELLLDGLNQYPVNITMSCVDEDGNGIPDDLEIFGHAAETSCCRADLRLASGKKPSARPKGKGEKRLTRKPVTRDLPKPEPKPKAGKAFFGRKKKK